jgi:hypothetical protein
VLLQAAPGFLAVVLLPMVPIAIFLLISFHYFIGSAIQRILLPMSRQAGVYGLQVTACTALGIKEWEKMQASAAERPDMSQGISNNGWITDDVQA